MAIQKKSSKKESSSTKCFPFQTAIQKNLCPQNRQGPGAPSKTVQKSASAKKVASKSFRHTSDTLPSISLIIVFGQ